MAKKVTYIKTAASALWAIIAAEMQAQHMTYNEIAKRCRCSSRTVSMDAAEPERIPQGRLWLYFAALGINADVVLAPIAKAYISNMVEEASA